MSTKKYKNTSLKEYIQLVSRKEPVPGGGSVAALSGSSACALLCMVTRYSIGKRDSKRDDRSLNALLKRFEVYKDDLLQLVDEDADAYLNLRASRKENKKKYQAALSNARRVPRQMSRICVKAINDAQRLKPLSNPYLISDIQIAIELLTATNHSAAVLVEANQ